MAGLSMTQQYAMTDLQRRGPGWHECHSVASPTVEALESRGHVKVRWLPTVHVSRTKSWYAVNPDAPDAPAPVLTLRQQMAEIIADAWRALGYADWRPSTPSEAQRKVAAEHFRKLAALLEG